MSIYPQVDERAYLGDFTVGEEGRIRVTDPCYERAIGTDVIQAKPGRWEATVSYVDKGMFGVRVSALTIKHSDGHEPMTNIRSIDVGVDSGQADFFDDARYPQGDTGEYGDLTTFYGKACDTTVPTLRDNELQGGIVDHEGPMGAVSVSGYGDGCYTLVADASEGQEVTAMRIIFISDED